MAQPSVSEGSSDAVGEPKFRLLMELGQGGAAQVVLAEQSGAQDITKLVVLKFLRPALAEHADMRESLVREARFTARLNHANIVQTSGLVQVQGGAAIVMEYLDGQPLSAILARTRATIPIALHLRILVETLNGLHYAHELTDLNGDPLEAVHRDVSPQNIFVTYDGRVKLIDFGIAKLAGAGVETATGVIKGKSRYMPPEQIDGSKVDRRADVYAVGVMLWEAATRDKMWKGKPDVAILRDVLEGKTPKPREVNPAVPEELERIILKALSFHREDRYATAMELEADLELFLGKSAPVTNRDLARFVSLEFEDVRAETKRTIEQRLKRRTPLSIGRNGLIPSDLLAPELESDSQQRPTVTSTSTPTSTPGHLSTPGPTSSSAHPPARSKGLRGPLLITAIVVVVGVVAWRVTSGPWSPPSVNVVTAAPSVESHPVESPPPERDVRQSLPRAAPTSTSAPSLEPAPSASVTSTEAVGAASEKPPTSRPVKPATGAEHKPHPGSSASAKAVKPECETPYTVDADGIKRIKLECL